MDRCSRYTPSKKLRFIVGILCFFLYPIELLAGQKWVRVVWHDSPDSSSRYTTNEASWTNTSSQYSTSFASHQHHHTSISGLTANTSVYFRACDDSGCSNDRYWFKTAPGAGNTDPFVFIAGGDTRSGWTNRQNGNRLVAKIRPLFVMHGGDFTNVNNQSEWQQWFIDWELTYSQDSINGQAYKRVYPLIPCRESDTYYGTTISDLLRVYTLNTQFQISALQSAQNNWLSQDLSDNGPDVNWRIAQYHKPMYPNGGGKPINVFLDNWWSDTFWENQMNLIVESDTHISKIGRILQPFPGNTSGFEVVDEGMMFIGEGSWGASARSIDSQKSQSPRYAAASIQQFKVIGLSGSKMEIRTVDFSGSGSASSLSRAQRQIQPTLLPEGLNLWNVNPFGEAVSLRRGSNKLTRLDTNGTGVAQIDGGSYVGELLSVEVFDPDNTESSSFTYQWKRLTSNNNTINIGQNQPGYMLTADDVDSVISVEVSYIDDEGSDELVTSSIGPITLTPLLQVALDASEDTFVALNSPNNNHNGSAEQLLVDDQDATHGKLMTLIKWQMNDVPACATITLAEFEVNVFNATDTVNIYEGVNSWQETTASWNSVGGTEQQGRLLGSFSPSSLGTHRTTFNDNGKDAIEQWLQGVNNGVILGTSSSNGMDATDRETEPAPKLYLEYNLDACVPTNQAPIANSFAVETNNITAVIITLQASDTDADPLSWELISQPANGTLSGNGADRVYTPDNGFIGSDSFTYRVSDGEAQSNIATVTVVVTGSDLVISPDQIISNAAQTITLDGNLNDWASYTGFAADEEDVQGANNPLDWLQAWMAHDGGNIYLAYRNAGSINPSWGQTVYIDTDSDRATGYNSGLAIGADYVLQGQYLYSYSGDGSNWSWNFVAEADTQSVGGDFEMRFEQAALGSPSTIRLAFVGGNAAYPNGTVEDLYPDGVYDSNATVRYLEYSVREVQNSAPQANSRIVTVAENTNLAITLSATDADGDALSFAVTNQPSNGVLNGTAPSLTYVPNNNFTGTDSFSFTANDGMLSSDVGTYNISVVSANELEVHSNLATGLTIDGNLSDWAALRSFGVDPDDVNGAENPIDYREGWAAHDEQNFYFAYRNDGGDIGAIEQWTFNLLIDSDQNPATGYRNGAAIGADFLVQGQYVYRHNTTQQSAWSWDYLGSASRATSGENTELAVSRQALDDINEFDLLLLGDNASLGGNTEDQYPDGVYNSQDATRYFTYSTNNLPSANSEPLSQEARMLNHEPIYSRHESQTNARELPGGSHTRQESNSSSAGTGSGAISPIWLLLSLLQLLLRRRNYRQQ